MHALAGQRVEVHRQRGGEGLAFAGAHLGDLAVVEHHAADQLHVEVAHAVDPLAGLADDRKGFGQQRVEALATPRGWRNSSVLPRSSSSLRGLDRGSSALIARTG